MAISTTQPFARSYTIKRITPSLSQQFWNYSGSNSPSKVLLLATCDGVVEVTTPKRRWQSLGSAIAWLPAETEPQIRIGPGCNGFIALFTTQSVIDCQAKYPKHLVMHALLGKFIAQEFEKNNRLFRSIKLSLEALYERGLEEYDLSQVISDAYLQVCLGLLAEIPQAGDPSSLKYGIDHKILFEFRELVESHFKEHWSIAQYAEALRVTPDRLHAVATRALGRKPTQLIQERLVHEAKVLIEHSGYSISQIAFALGFKEASHFSNFFAKRTGLSPARYRSDRETAKAIRAPDEAQGMSFADWP